MRKPLKPLPADCCGSGCRRCVYDIYADHLAKYRQWLKEKETSEEIESQSENI